jgi:DNA gyrase subunit A
MIGIKGADRNGAVVAAHAVSDDESVISITSDQQMVRSAVSDFSVQGRMAQGVKLVRLSEGATLVSVSVCEGEEEAEKDSAAEGAEAPQPPAENAEAPAPSEGDAEPKE